MLLGFYKQFVDPILIGTKPFTVRKRRKITPKIGETLYMYTGGYNSSRTLITNKEKLISTQSIRITIERKVIDKKRSSTRIDIWIDRRKLSIDEVKIFVRYDGFENIAEWTNYWLGKKNRLGALMVIYHWTDLRL